MKKALFLLLINFLLINGCSQRYHITLNHSPDVGGQVQAQLQLMPLFTRYLQDIDLFAGLSVSQDQLPSFVENFLNNELQAVSPTVDYNTDDNSFLVHYTLNFNNIKQLTNSSDQFLNNLITVSHHNNTTTLRLLYNQQTRQKLQQLYPILPPANPINDTGRSGYLASLAATIASNRAERSLAQTEISNSPISLTFKTPRPIKSIQGGEISPHDNTVAIFNFSLFDILYPVKPISLQLTY